MSLWHDQTIPNCALLTDDASPVLEFAVKSFVAGTPTALATMLEIRGGGFRRMGAPWACERMALIAALSD